jgi:hypothetical protein
MNLSEQFSGNFPEPEFREKQWIFRFPVSPLRGTGTENNPQPDGMPHENNFCAVREARLSRCPGWQRLSWYFALAAQSSHPSQSNHQPTKGKNLLNVCPSRGGNE